MHLGKCQRFSSRIYAYGFRAAVTVPHFRRHQNKPL